MKTLEGIRVLDLSQALSGPFCTMQLADHGAEVIKVEAPDGGDITRKWLPQINGKSAYFTTHNRNKKSVTLDLRKPEGKEVFLNLVKTADVVMDNYRGGTMQKYGLTYEALKEVNPKIITASISGYGNWGPTSKRPAFGITIEAESGFMDLTGFPDGAPVKSGNSVADILTGTFAAYAICMALYRREKTGEGQSIDVSMLDTMFHALEASPLVTHLTGKPPHRTGNRTPAGTPMDAYEASDGYCVFLAPVWTQWQALCRLMGHEELIGNPEYADYTMLKKHEEEITDWINEWSRTLTREELGQQLGQNGIAFSFVLDVKESMNNPQIRARDMVVELDDSKMGKIQVQGIPVKMSATPGAVKTSAPELGQDNEGIYSEIGLTEEDMKSLREKGII